MATYTSDQTTPTGVAQRVQELEAVLKYVLDKLKDLTAPEGSDAEKLARMYNLALRGARSNNSSTDPYAATIYDTYNSSISQSVFGVIDSSMTDRMSAVLTGRPIIDTVFPNNDNRWFATSMTLSSLTFGAYSEDGTDYATPIWSVNTSLVKLIFGNSFGNDAMLKAFTGNGTRAPEYLAEQIWGSASTFNTWRSTGKTVASAVAALESRMTMAENRLSSGGL